MSIILWVAENGGDAFGGIRSARFFKYLKFFKLKYVRFLRIGLQLRNMSGGHVAAVYRKAIEPESRRVKEAMKKVRAVFDEQFCEEVYANLRSFLPELADSAVSLVEEFFREGYDAESVMMVSQQLHAVRHNVNKEHLEMVYEWLAFHARHKEKIAFLDAMIYSRDFMATVGEKAMQRRGDPRETRADPKGIACPRRRRISRGRRRTSCDVARTSPRRRGAPNAR